MAKINSDQKAQILYRLMNGKMLSHLNMFIIQNIYK